MTETNTPPAQEAGYGIGVPEEDGREYSEGTTFVLTDTHGLVGWKYHFDPYARAGDTVSSVPHDEFKDLLYEESVADFPDAARKYVDTFNEVVSEEMRGGGVSQSGRNANVHPPGPHGIRNFQNHRDHRLRVELWAMRNITERGFYNEWMFQQTVWRDPRVPHNLKFPAYIALVRSTLMAACNWQNTENPARWAVIEANMVEFDEFYEKFLVDTSAGIHSTYSRMYAGKEFRKVVETNGQISLQAHNDTMLMRPQFHTWRMDYFTRAFPTHLSQAHDQGDVCQPMYHPSHRYLGRDIT